MRRKTTTIRDVALRAGVSVSTVSHVLNGNAQHVGAATREHILKIVDELNYRPNAIARSMVKRRTATVGLIITELENPLFPPVIGGVEEVLRAEGYHIVLASAPTVADEIEAIETLRAQQVDGFIFMSLSRCCANEHLMRLKDEGVPFVVINRCMEDANIPQVQFDDRGVGYQATMYLLQLGHTRIGTLCGPISTDIPRRSALERHQGWQQALQQHDITVPESWIIPGEYTCESGYQAAAWLVALMQRGEELPTALFIANDTMALGAIKQFYQAGVRVPDDISIITIGDPPLAAYSIPALTTFSLPVPEAGRVAARMLLDWFKYGQPEAAQSVTLSFSLCIRESCGAKT